MNIRDVIKATLLFLYWRVNKYMVDGASVGIQAVWVTD